MSAPKYVADKVAQADISEQVSQSTETEVQIPTLKKEEEMVEVVKLEDEIDETPEHTGAPSTSARVSIAALTLPFNVPVAQLLSIDPRTYPTKSTIASSNRRVQAGTFMEDTSPKQDTDSEDSDGESDSPIPTFSIREIKKLQHNKIQYYKMRQRQNRMVRTEVLGARLWSDLRTQQRATSHNVMHDYAVKLKESMRRVFRSNRTRRERRRRLLAELDRATRGAKIAKGSKNVSDGKEK